MTLRISNETWIALRLIGHRADTADDLIRKALKLPQRDKTKLWKRKK